MKPFRIISATIICGLTVIVLVFIAGYFLIGSGCGCVSVVPSPPVPRFNMDLVNESSGTYIDMVYLDSYGVGDVKNMALVSKSYNASSISYLNETLTPGNTYRFKAVNTKGTIFVASVLADGNETIVNSTIL